MDFAAIAVKCFDHRKIRLIEGNVKCPHLKNLPVKGICGRCYLPEAQNPVPLPFTHCTCVYNVLIHTGKGGGGR
jgi:hypothetical protein